MPPATPLNEPVAPGTRRGTADIDRKSPTPLRRPRRRPGPSNPPHSYPDPAATPTGGTPPRPTWPARRGGPTRTRGRRPTTTRACRTTAACRPCGSGWCPTCRCGRRVGVAVWWVARPGSTSRAPERCRRLPVDIGGPPPCSGGDRLVQWSGRRHRGYRLWPRPLPGVGGGHLGCPARRLYLRLVRDECRGVTQDPPRGRRIRRGSGRGG